MNLNQILIRDKNLLDGGQTDGEPNMWICIIMPTIRGEQRKNKELGLISALCIQVQLEDVDMFGPWQTWHWRWDLTEVLLQRQLTISFSTTHSKLRESPLFLSFISFWLTSSLPAQVLSASGGQIIAVQNPALSLSGAFQGRGSPPSSSGHPPPTSMTGILLSASRNLSASASSPARMSPNLKQEPSSPPANHHREKD